VVPPQNEEKKMKSLTAEINNGRLAMMAIIGCSVVSVAVVFPQRVHDVECGNSMRKADRDHSFINL